jgi:hypothetical protein
LQYGHGRSNAVRTAILTAAIIVAGAFAAPPSPAKGLVEIKVRGYYFSAPATVPVVIAVEPGANNRSLIVEADSDDYYRSSSIELDGDKEKRLHTVELRNLPAGEYVLRAQVKSKSAVLATAVEGLVVTGLTTVR